ncbi:HypC/HybG/HupF family hydrogenase formation chaperone [Telmatospirillum siberiense]|uniref:HypC/HybG/HupF family hydrogenase formation chaperone n=1 Tax=Telmatospirillum siberiense TaxID=382514 RepID=A0A2N3PSJ7_9PROT|nr:HypC/HybG/HupF family hydrogenase formation chaperone [Telmatospirillum siberiense]PKU23372.1 HypC/HybG/HupF family hydrogenase formation chaperone [Telmatospirillum siberiense]
MCIGIPMQVEVPGDMQALCRPRGGQAVEIDMRLLDPVPAGGWVLTHRGLAREALDAEDARLIADALDAALLAAEGDNVDHLFADLLGREPELPAHLRKA